MFKSTAWQRSLAANCKQWMIIRVLLQSGAALVYFVSMLLPIVIAPMDRERAFLSFVTSGLITGMPFLGVGRGFSLTGTLPGC
jgi:hypothetical protein